MKQSICKRMAPTAATEGARSIGTARPIGLAKPVKPTKQVQRAEPAKPVKLAALVTTLALVLTSALFLSACGGGAVAATVNGENIMEADVTRTIEDMRSVNDQFQDDAAWAAALAAEGLTPESLREQVVEQLVGQVLLEQEAEAQGISLDEVASEVDQSIESLETQAGGKDAMLSVLKASGFGSEDQYRDYLTRSMLSGKLANQVVSLDEPTDEELQTYAAEHGSEYEGRRSSHILITNDSGDDPEGLAQEVLAKALAGEDFAALAAEYSEDPGSAANGGDVGWDWAATFVSGYQNALDALAEGAITPQPAESEFGYHIIKCTQRYVVPASGAVFAEMPAEAQQDIRTKVANSKLTEAFNEHMAKVRENAEVTVNEMPSGLSYDVS